MWLAGSRAQAQELWHTGLAAPRHVGSSWTRARTHVPCIGRWTLNHCTTREVPKLIFKEHIFQTARRSIKLHYLLRYISGLIIVLIINCVYFFLQSVYNLLLGKSSITTLFPLTRLERVHPSRRRCNTGAMRGADGASPCSDSLLQKSV